MIIAIFIINTIITTTTSIIILVPAYTRLAWNYKKSRAGAAQSLFLWFSEERVLIKVVFRKKSEVLNSKRIFRSTPSSEEANVINNFPWYSY